MLKGRPFVPKRTPKVNLIVTSLHVCSANTFLAIVQSFNSGTEGVIVTIFPIYLDGKVVTLILGSHLERLNKLLVNQSCSAFPFPTCVK